MVRETLAIAAYTIGAAYACRQDHALGTITPGKLADFAILETDPLTADISTISDIPIAATVIAVTRPSTRRPPATATRAAPWMR